MEDILPPKGTRGVNAAPVNTHAKSARARMEAMGFDPIVELVKTHQRLGREVDLQEEIRDGTTVVLLPTGKPRGYNSQNHMSAMEAQARVATTLAEYSDKKAGQEKADVPVIPFTINVNRSKK